VGEWREEVKNGGRSWRMEGEAATSRRSGRMEKGAA